MKPISFIETCFIFADGKGKGTKNMPKVTQEYLEKKKEMIVEAAYQVCLKKPVEMVTISDVIAETGMSMGAIYRYYDGLDDILADMLKKIRKDYDYYGRIEKLSNEKDLSFEEITYRTCDIIGEVMEKHLMDRNGPVFISHGDCEEDANMVADEIKKRFGMETQVINYVGPVIGAHTGCGVIALFFIGKER